jgi:hypothetical protein
MSDAEYWSQTEALVMSGKGVDFVPPSLYEWADANGNINLTSDQKNEYMLRAELVRYSTVAKAYEKNPHSNETAKDLIEFKKMRETKSYSEIEMNKIKELAKRMIVFGMMKDNISKIKL